MNGYCDCDQYIEAQAWLWQHKATFLVLGVLVVIGLAISGTGF